MILTMKNTLQPYLKAANDYEIIMIMKIYITTNNNWVMVAVLKCRDCESD